MSERAARQTAPPGRAGRFFFRLLALTAFAIAALGFWMRSDPDRGVPTEEQLVAVTGTLQRMKSNEGTVRFYLVGHEHGFAYSSKMGRGRAVAKALSHSGAKVGLKYAPDSLGGPLYSDEKFFDVFELSVNGEMARSYDQIRQSWISDNKFGGGGMGIIFTLMGLYILRQVRRDLRANMPPPDSA